MLEVILITDPIFTDIIYIFNLTSMYKLDMEYINNMVMSKSKLPHVNHK